MRNKGFTIIELMAVIVILGILSSIALIGISRYRQIVSEKEIINLRSTIETAYDNYRTNEITKGKSYKTELDFNVNEQEEISKYFDGISYDGKRLTNDNIKGLKIELKTKGDLLNIKEYTQEKEETEIIKDGACLIKSQKESSEETNLACERDATDSNKIIPSKEELICIKLEIDNKTIINDFEDNKSLCKYFKESDNE